MYSKLLKLLLSGLSILLLISGYLLYYKGKRECKQQVEIAALKELNAAQEAIANIKYVTDTKIGVIREKLRKSSPLKKVDSYKTCLLSSNPLQSECSE